MGVYDDVIEDSYVDFDVNIVSVFFQCFIIFF